MNPHIVGIKVNENIDISKVSMNKPCIMQNLEGFPYFLSNLLLLVLREAA